MTKKKKRRLKAGVIYLMITVCLVIAGISLWNIIMELQAQRQYRIELNRLQQMYSEPEKVSLSSINSDYVGWIKIAGTQVDLPVVQTTNNDKYLTINFEGEKSKYGTTFVDYRTDLENSEDVVVIYSHHMKDGQMFADLLKYKNSDYLSEHKTVQFCRVDDCREYEIVAALEVDLTLSDQFNYLTLLGNIDRKGYFDTLKRQAVFYHVMDIDKPFLILSTCSYISSDARFAVFAVEK